MLYKTIVPETKKLNVGNIFCYFNLTVIFNLDILNIIFLYVLSVRQKVPKNSAHGKNLRKRPLFTPHTVSPQSGTSSSLQAFAMHPLDFSTVPFNKLLALAAKSQISLDFAHLRVTFRRWWGNYLCYEYPLLHFANFIAYNGNVKKNRHHQNHRQNPFCFWIKWPGLFDC